MRLQDYYSKGALLLSCSLSNTYKEKLSGQWAIDNVYHKGVDYTNAISINFMVFKEDSIVSLPKVLMFEKEYAGWHLITIDDKIKVKIDCNNAIFKGVYEINFIKDSKEKLLGVELNSETTYIKAFKFFQNYDVDGSDW